ncbi:MAG: hypothetical protein ACOYD3_07440, partial [Kiritimatiellia bacterium]
MENDTAGDGGLHIPASPFTCANHLVPKHFVTPTRQRGMAFRLPRSLPMRLLEPAVSAVYWGVHGVENIPPGT